jgi:hypothetical protein
MIAQIMPRMVGRRCHVISIRLLAMSLFDQYVITMEGAAIRNPRDTNPFLIQVSQ